MIGWFLVAHLALAETSAPFKPHCKDKVNAQLAAVGAQHWFRVVDPSPGAKAFRSPARDFGQWLEIHIYPSATRLISVANRKVKTHYWNKTCEVSVTEGNWRSEVKGDRSRFSDRELRDHLDSKKAGVIYLWSPGMVYSMQMLKPFESVAQRIGLEFVPVNAADLDSVELSMRSVSAHYPRTWVFKDGKMSLQPLTGVFAERVFEQHIRDMLKELR